MKSPLARMMTFLLAVMLIASLPAPSFSRQSGSSDQDKEKSGKSSKPKRHKEREDVYKKWMDEDVRWIITDEERGAFKKLKTDEEREQFIEQFWLRRDPDPDTPENEYREEYYRRIAYANEKFTSGIPGWKTDRGRIYIAFGQADSVEAHPAGGPYERPLYEGGGQTSTFPFEVWFYRHIDNVGDGIEIEFVDPTMSGEYRIARSPDEKDALLDVPNAGLTLLESMGFSDKSRRPAFNGGQYDRSNSTFGQGRLQDQEFEKLQLLTNLSRPPAVKYADLATHTSDPKIDFDVLPFSFRTDYLRVSNDSVVTSFTVQLEHQDLAFENKGGIYQGTVNIHAKITALTGRRFGVFEDALQTGRYTDRSISDGQQAKSVYQKNLILPPGRYKIDIVARDVASGKTGVIHQAFSVPKYEENQLSTSSVIVADEIQPIQGVPTGQFVIGRLKVRPSVGGNFRPSQLLGVFLQVYNTEVDQTTLRPDVSIDYVITKDGKQVKMIHEDGKQGISQLDGERLTVARLIPLEGLNPGSYQVSVLIRDNVAQKTINPTAQFSVVQ